MNSDSLYGFLAFIIQIQMLILEITSNVTSRVLVNILFMIKIYYFFSEWHPLVVSISFAFIKQLHTSLKAPKKL